MTPDDKKAWQAIAKSVKPLGFSKSSRRRPKASEDTQFVPVRRNADDTKKRFSKPENRAHEKSVRRGRVQATASLDLHGHSQSSAWSILPRFLLREQRTGSRCVIVITGKGKAGGGVLRRNFQLWLESPDARSLVSGYAQAHQKDGGAGAWYVFLRRS